MTGLRDILVFINGHQAIFSIFITGLLTLGVLVMVHILIYRAVPAWIERTSPVFNVRVLTVATEDLTRGLLSAPSSPEGTGKDLGYQFFSSLPHGFMQSDWNMAQKETHFSIPTPPRTEGDKASPYHMVYVWIVNNEPAVPPSKLEISDYQFDIEVQVGGTVEFISNEHRSLVLMLDGSEAFFAVFRSALVSPRRNHTDKVILRQQRLGSENVGFGTKDNSRR